MPEDAKFPFGFDDTGDVATVDGDEFYYRHALQLAHLSVEDNRGEGMTPTDIADIEADIREGFSSSPLFEPPINVTITSIDSERLTLDVTAGNVSEFEIEV